MYENKFIIKSIYFIAIIALVTMFASCSDNKTEKNTMQEDKKEFVVKKSDKKPSSNKLVYIVSDTSIPFWAIMGRGFSNAANLLGYDSEIYSSDNNAKKELELTAKAIKDNVAGIIISPTSSSSCVTILKLAKYAGIPVVISDIGTDSGEYVSFISSDNKNGAYSIGKVLSKKMKTLGWHNGKVGIVAIPQKRLNGQLRTAGFMKAIDEAGIKSIDIKQQVTFSLEETYNFVKDMIEKYPRIRAIWLQGSDKYKGALQAIEDSNRKGEILLVTFDAEPEFLELIPNGTLVGAAMQQPFLMGQEAVYSMDDFLNGKEFEKDLQLPILAVSTDTIDEQLPTIKRNVLGL